MYKYNKLINKLNDKGLCKNDLTTLLNISSRTIAKIGKGEKIAPHVLLKIANFLGCNIEDLYEIVSSNPILQILKEEKEYKISGGLYHEFQVRMTYNSNHIEGSKLTEDQTRLIFETRTINTDGDIPIDDIIETSNHFRAIDYCIDHAEEELSEKIIKDLHYILKQSTHDSTLDWSRVGEYKAKANVVGGRETTKPKDVPLEMKSLVSNYNMLNNPTIENIIEFHSKFEHIHPFQDGNGRVGRLIAFKECLHFNIIPFIIEDCKKSYYYHGLSEWPIEKGFLIDTCLDGQDTFKALLKLLDIPF